MLMATNLEDRKLLHDSPHHNRGADNNIHTVSGPSVFPSDSQSSVISQRSSAMTSLDAPYHQY